MSPRSNDLALPFAVDPYKIPTIHRESIPAHTSVPCKRAGQGYSGPVQMTPQKISFRLAVNRSPSHRVFSSCLTYPSRRAPSISVVDAEAEWPARRTGCTAGVAGPSARSEDHVLVILEVRPLRFREAFAGRHQIKFPSRDNLGLTSPHSPTTG
jgi:hypothetical protein